MQEEQITCKNHKCLHNELVEHNVGDYDSFPQVVERVLVLLCYLTAKHLSILIYSFYHGSFKIVYVILMPSISYCSFSPFLFWSLSLCLSLSPSPYFVFHIYKMSEISCPKSRNLSPFQIFL